MKSNSSRSWIMRVVSSRSARKKLTLIVLVNVLIVVMVSSKLQSMNKTKSSMGFSKVHHMDGSGGRGEVQRDDRSDLALKSSATKRHDKDDISCEMELNADYFGREVLQDGTKHETDSFEACQEACKRHGRCNIWVWCDGDSGCGGEKNQKPCWLKFDESLNPARPQGARSPDVKWMSGSCVTRKEREMAKREFNSMQSKEKARLEKLKSNKSLPLVYFDVEIEKKPVGRIEMVLFTDISPRSAENFRQLVTGEAGIVPPGKEGAGTPYHFKGAAFYRIIHQFIDQSGINVPSVYGGKFKDDSGGLKLRHDKKGLLSMANIGPDTNTAHFSIMMGPAPHLDGHYTIFGQVVSGFDVVDKVNALSIGMPENTANAEAGAVIVDCGQMRKGTLVPDLKKP